MALISEPEAWSAVGHGDGILIQAVLPKQPESNREIAVYVDGGAPVGVLADTDGVALVAVSPGSHTVQVAGRIVGTDQTSPLSESVSVSTAAGKPAVIEPSSWAHVPAGETPAQVDFAFSVLPPTTVLWEVATDPAGPWASFVGWGDGASLTVAGDELDTAVLTVVLDEEPHDAYLRVTVDGTSSDPRALRLQNGGEPQVLYGAFQHTDLRGFSTSTSGSFMREAPLSGDLFLAIDHLDSIADSELFGAVLPTTARSRVLCIDRAAKAIRWYATTDNTGISTEVLVPVASGGAEYLFWRTRVETDQTLTDGVGVPHQPEEDAVLFILNASDGSFVGQFFEEDIGNIRTEIYPQHGGRVWAVNSQTPMVIEASTGNVITGPIHGAITSAGWANATSDAQGRLYFHDGLVLTRMDLDGSTITFETLTFASAISTAATLVHDDGREILWILTSTGIDAIDTSGALTQLPKLAGTTYFRQNAFVAPNGHLIGNEGHSSNEYIRVSAIDPTTGATQWSFNLDGDSSGGGDNDVTPGTDTFTYSADRTNFTMLFTGQNALQMNGAPVPLIGDEDLTPTTTRKYLVTFKVDGSLDEDVIGGGDGTSSLDAIPAPPMGGWPNVIEEETPAQQVISGADTLTSAEAPGAAALQVKDASAWSAATATPPAALGAVTIAQHDPAEETGPAYLQAIVGYQPDPEINGDGYFDLRWVVDGRTSKVSRAHYEVGSVYDAPTPPEGGFADIYEGQWPNIGAFSTTDPDGPGWTWELNNNPSDEELGTSSQSSVVWTDPDTGDEILFEITTGQGTRSIAVRATGPALYSGSPSVSMRVTDGGDPATAEDEEPDDGWTTWQTFSFQVLPIDQPPSAPSPTNWGTTPEDTPLTYTVTWTDADSLEGGSWELQHSPDGIAWVSDGPIDLAGAVVRILANYEAPEPPAEGIGPLEATVRIEPRGNYSGVVRHYARIYARGHLGDDLYSPVVEVTGTIGAIADDPSRPTPSTMPPAEPGETVVGTFTTVDADGVSWNWAIKQTTGGVWGSSITLPGVGTLTLVDDDLSDRKTEVRRTPDAGNLLWTGRYAFYLQVTDSTGRTSQPTLVQGSVTWRGLQADLVRLTRTETGVTITALTPVNVLRSRYSEAVQGPGDANVELAAAEMVRRADQLGMTVEELLDPAATELWLTLDGALVFAGPIEDVEPTRFDSSSLGGTIDLTCRGLGAWLEKREVESELEFVAEDTADVGRALLAHTQAQPYGDLALVPGTATVGENITSTVPAGANIVRELDDMGEGLETPEWWVTPTREFNIEPVRGVDRRGQVLLTDGSTTELEASGSLDAIATVVYVEGDGVVGSASADAPTLARLGRQVRRLRAPRITDQAVANAIAAEQVSFYARADRTLRISHVVTPTSGVQLDSYAVGDAISAEVETSIGRRVYGMRVVAREVEISQGSSDTRYVTLDVELLDDDEPIRPARSRITNRVLEQLYDARYRAA